MDSKTLKALKESINKWKELAAGPRLRFGTGASSCPLCHLFNRSYVGLDYEDGQDCVGCPVRDETLQEYCRGTPYRQYDGSPETASPMLDFLVTLLPQKKSK